MEILRSFEVLIHETKPQMEPLNIKCGKLYLLGSELMNYGDDVPDTLSSGILEIKRRYNNALSEKYALSGNTCLFEMINEKDNSITRGILIHEKSEDSEPHFDDHGSEPFPFEDSEPHFDNYASRRFPFENKPRSNDGDSNGSQLENEPRFDDENSNSSQLENKPRFDDENSSSSQLEREPHIDDDSTSSQWEGCRRSIWNF